MSFKTNSRPMKGADMLPRRETKEEEPSWNGRKWSEMVATYSEKLKQCCEILTPIFLTCVGNISAPYCQTCNWDWSSSSNDKKKNIYFQRGKKTNHNRYLLLLGPGRPSAGGPRMDRRTVTSPGVVQIWRLASRLRRSARRGPDPTAVLTLIKRLMIIP